MYRLLLVCLLILSCNKEEVTVTVTPKTITQEGKADCVINPSVNSDWTRKLNNIILYHTDGLEQMALSGSHNSLNKEYCSIGTGAFIPKGLGDIENAGYAGIREYDGWAIAMYHPTSKYPDNWIMYNINTRGWERYDLGLRGVNSSGIILLSSGVAETSQN